MDQESFADVGDRILHLPGLKVAKVDDAKALDENTAYCYRMTWLGEKYDHTRFPEVSNKTCSEYFDKTDTRLCIDPMAVTVSGKKPNFKYVLDNYPKEATCRLSQDQACAKYTMYYNGIPSRVVRYCTRIDIEYEGPMQSGCLTEKEGSYSYEICACISGLGMNAICNKAGFSSSNHFITCTIIIIIYILIS